MFGNKRNKLHIQLTVDDSVDIRAVRDYLVSVVFRKMSFVKHASASFGIFSHNVVAEDYETTRAYEGIAEKVVDDSIKKLELEQLKNKVSDIQDEIDERIALDGNQHS